MKSFFDKLFGKNNQTTLEVPTKPLSKEETELAADLAGIKNTYEPPQLIIGCAQSVGMQREHNEDALFTLSTNLTGNHGSLPFGLFIVADGMGGHQYGEVASGIAVRALASHIVRRLYVPLLSLQPSSPEDSLQEILQEGVQEAHKAILKAVPGGGTTLTSALIFGDQLIIAHVGDSRAYAISAQGQIETLTRDHSLVKRLVELGQITNEEAAIHPQRNVLYRALGQGEPFDSDVSVRHLPESGYLLLCSDGLWNVVSEEEIYQIISSSPHPEIACQRLINRANEAGGPDNITSILIQLPE